MILYTKTVCGKCMLVKTLLNEAKIEYEVVNLDFDEVSAEKLRNKGFMGMPILLDEGKYYADIPSIQGLIAEKTE